MLMNAFAQSMNFLLRLCGGGALILGLAFWSGHYRYLTRLHIGLGMAVVISLWILAGIAWKHGARTSLVLFAAGWGALTWIVGVTQYQLLPGSLHWIVAVAHLLLGMVSIGLGGQLARTVEARPLRPSASA